MSDVKRCIRGRREDEIRDGEITRESEEYMRGEDRRSIECECEISKDSQSTIQIIDPICISDGGDTFEA